MATDVATDVVKFHISLNASYLTKSIAFYRVLLGVEPTLIRDDYAKFEVAEPPMIMSLVPVAPSPGGNVNHVGLRFPDCAALVAVQARLEQAGYATQREEGVECCYSKQTKFWITDPDRTLWEIYVLHAEADEHDHAHDHAQVDRGVAGNSTVATASLKLPVMQPGAASENNAAKPAERVVWMHMLTQPLPERIERDDASIDEVQMHGTFNMKVERAQLAQFLQEVRRVLRPGGAIVAHLLTTDGRAVDDPGLPGPAALVDRVLPAAEVVSLINEAGFIGVRFTKLAERACFTVGQAEMRETKIAASLPSAGCCATTTYRLVYKGPLAEASDDLGNVYPRGTPVAVTDAAWTLLQATGAAEQFTCLNGTPNAGGCCN